MSYGLGLDAGGAYTDAVLMNMSDGRIVGKAKAPTTMDDLSVGIGEAVRGLRAFDGGDVAMVSLSSTLAANSVVEGKGCRVGLVCIGRAFDGSVPVDACAVISGGHDAKGREACALDEEAARNAVASMKGRVDGIAVASYMSVRNPDHEDRVKKIAAMAVDAPIVCGHELSPDLGFNERTAASVMNARLIPMIGELVGSVKEVMAENGIGAPLMIVRGVRCAAAGMRLPPEKFISLVKAAVARRLSEELLGKLLFEETGEPHPCRIAKNLMDKAISGKEGLDLGCSVRLNKPMIGVGAAADAYLPEVAKRFGAQLLLPEHSEVGNAVGAITGSIMETLDALIRPRAGGDPNDPPCTAFSMLGRMEFGSVSEALEHLSDEGGENVRKRAEKAGADDADVKMEVSGRRYEIGVGGGGDVLLEIDVHISAVGKPRHFHARP
ncbi:MAG: hypothetical protein LBT41_04570 [Candidatus Methanoplasma sp.]|jgi:N-methylhydantoinase A/oxoprolinase/acetone carboxylase beta subunit|nr:hypothetical protein [Candidatus Methanoplasma sp.]